MTVVRGELIGGGVKKVKGLSKSPQNLTDRQQYGDCQRKRGWWEVEEGKEGISGDGRGPDWGGEHTIQCADNVL